MGEHNKTVAWYFASMGAEVDLHSFHLHGNTVLHTSAGHRDDTINIFPGQAEAMVMVADNAGTWLLHCHTLDHIIAGMETTYTMGANNQDRTAFPKYTRWIKSYLYANELHDNIINTSAQSSSCKNNETVQ